MNVFRNVSPELTSKSSPIAWTTASDCPTYLSTVGLSSAFPATHVTDASSGSFGLGHSPRRESDVTANLPERTAYLHTCRPTKPLPPMTSNLRLSAPGMVSCILMVEKRKADAVARRPARTTCENRFIEES